MHFVPLRPATASSAFSMLARSPRLEVFWSMPTRSAACCSCPSTPTASTAAPRIPASRAVRLATMAGSAPPICRAPASSMSVCRSLPCADGSRAIRASSTALPGNLTSVSSAAASSRASPSVAASSSAGTHDTSPRRISRVIAVIRSSFGPPCAAFKTVGSTAASLRSASATSSRGRSSSGKRFSSVASASVTSRPGSSRAVRSPIPTRSLSLDRNCSISSGMPPEPRARIAPRIASRCR